MLRLIDLFISVIGILLLSPALICIFFMQFFGVCYPIFFQARLGKHCVIFTIVKFRTMKVGTASIGSHQVPPQAVTSFGRLLRRYKVDELPQLLNVLRGEMSLVGPRPCLPSQIELIEEREKRGVFDVRPGITGLAQIKGIDMSTPQLLAETDAQMIATMNLKNYFKYIVLTVLGRGFGDRVGPKK